MTGSGIYTRLDGPKWAAPEGGCLRSESRPPIGVLEDREREVIGSVAPRKPHAKELDKTTIAQVAGSAQQLFTKEQTSADQPEDQDSDYEYEDYVAGDSAEDMDDTARPSRQGRIVIDDAQGPVPEDRSGLYDLFPETTPTCSVPRHC